MDWTLCKPWEPHFCVKSLRMWAIQDHGASGDKGCHFLLVDLAPNGSAGPKLRKLAGATKR